MIVLETERLIFRDHEPADLEPYCAMEADPEVRRYVGGLPRTRSAAEQKFRTVYLPAGPDRLRLRGTVFKPDGSYIGYCGIYPHFVDGVPQPAEGMLAFYLSRAYWGRGLATEAGSAFIALAFGEWKLSRIVSSVEDGNDASMRVLAKLGFRWFAGETVNGRSFRKFELRKESGGSTAALHIQ
jgi:[ribosomal protein S5]-alanine N-acetyltransferase